MNTRGGRLLVIAAMLLVGGVMLGGCPKRPEVGQGSTTAIGPAAAARPSPAPSAGAAPPREPGVTPPAPPREGIVAAPPAPPPAPSQAAPPPAPPATASPVVPVEPRPAPAPEPPPQAAAPPASSGAQAAAPAAEAPSLKDIFFDFDMSVIRPDQRPVLDENVAWLKANPQATVTIEGHCDERGTPEYNIALGERRATAVKDHLVAAGVDAARMRTVSFGEERPFVMGHDESAWKWNRRAHFLVAQQ
jgi:peptidoglycan-associated lipoprotein